MAITAATLRTLHRLLEQLADLRARLERGPKQIALREQNVEQRKSDLAAAQEVQKQARLQADRKQLDLRDAEQRIVDWNAKLNSASSNKEYQTLQEQIAATEMANSVLTDEILEGLERIDSLGEAVKAAEASVEATKDELEKVRKQVEEAAEGIRNEITRLEADLSECEATLPGDFRENYHRVVRVKGADGLADVEDDVCAGCGQQITPNMQNELLLSRPVFCKACGRLLYLPE